MKYIIIILILMSVRAYGCDQFLGEMICMENGQTFSHTLAKGYDGYLLLVSNESEEKLLVLNGEKITHYYNGGKNVTGGDASCSKNKLIVTATSEKVLYEPNEQIDLTLETTYEFINNESIRFNYTTTTTTIIDDDQPKVVVQNGGGTCVKRAD